MSSSVYCYVHVLRRENGHVLRKKLELTIECQGKKGREGEVDMDERMNVDLSMEDGL